MKEFKSIEEFDEFISRSRMSKKYFFDMSEIAKGANSRALAQRKPAISEHELGNSLCEFPVR